MAISDFTIRLATPADLPTMVALDQQIFGVYGGDEDPQIIAARLQVFAAGCAIIQHKSGEVAGYLTTEKWAEQRDPALNEDPFETHDDAGRILNITTLAIRPKFQNQKLGGFLLNYAERLGIAHGCDSLILETARAQRFYEQHGYALVGERDQQGVHLYILQRSLAN